MEIAKVLRSDECSYFVENKIMKLQFFYVTKSRKFFIAYPIPFSNIIPIYRDTVPIAHVPKKPKDEKDAYIVGYIYIFQHSSMNACSFLKLTLQIILHP